MHLNGVEIREFTYSDAPGISNMIRNNVLKTYAREYSKSVVNTLYKYFTPNRIIEIAQKREMFVATFKQQLIGTISLEKNTIYTVFVQYEQHRKGIGTLLINFIEKRALKNGYNQLQLAASLTAYKFFKKQGYQRSKRIQTEKFGQNILMKKDL